MARPTKQGLDYFPLDVQFDDKIEMYIIEKEAIGLSVLLTTWQIIYSNNGYYTDNGNDLFLLIKKRINVNINEIKECINLCLERGIFDKNLHDKYCILTSKAIQKRYFEAAKRKKEVHYDSRYLLLKSVNDYKNLINVCNNSVDVLHQSLNVNVNVKENVNVNAKETKTETRVSENFIEKLITAFCKSYENNKGVKYIVSEKDKKQMGLLLSSVKKQFPEYNTEQMFEAMMVLFDKANAISDDNFLSEINISKLNSQINNYLQRIKNGTAKHNARNFAGDSDAKWERILAKMG